MKGGGEMGQKSERRDGMMIDWNVPLKMDDGLVLCADVCRPIEDGRYPVILTYGVYAKGLSYQEGYPMQWEKMVTDHPEILQGSTNKYQNWEVTDPERWVPHGYAVVRVDSRGAGWSPGFMDCNSPREIDDLYQCIEWAGTQPWSSGKVGMLGISYYASNQWRVAGKHPPHLTAIIPWEGQNDRYRDSGYHGGILSQFQERWAKHQVVNVQYGRGERAKKNPNTGESVAGPVTLSDEELAKNCVNVFEELKKHPLDDEWHRSRSADLSQVTLPLLTCANWGGQGIHPRGNFNGFTQTPSKQKWLEVHGDSHWSLFSSGYGLALQKRFFDYFLKGLDNGWNKQPPVQLNVRHPGEKFVLRMENEWPLARTQWTKFYLDPVGLKLSPKPLGKEGKVEYEALGKGVTFSMAPLEKTTEITGPLAAKLFVSSSTKDADLFLIVRVFDPDGKELTFMGSTDPNTPIANGWLRVSHRRLDLKRSKPYQPYHPHDRVEPLTPGEVYECDVEILPTCIVLPRGWRVVLTVRGKDYEYEGELSEFGKKFHYGTRGTGGMTHADPDDRPKDVFGGKVTLYSGGGRASYLLVPIIPT
ncbi:MAG TPA: CocE/NonD family hydrolase [Thermodesulfobacteriota bacterium]|nr:CocE/NonD family hydrolase [Thermodesulfobacteriota bacterium]